MRTGFSFSRVASTVANLAGTPRTLVLALAIVLIWLVSGPFFGFSDTWQLVINTGTTIVTFLMVFLIQNTQNRDTVSMHLKLDELIRVTKGAHNALLDLEELSQDDLGKIRREYEELAEEARKDLRRGQRDTGSPEVPQGRGGATGTGDRASG
jgi:low affinity Fe/Cu permease